MASTPPNRNNGASNKPGSAPPGHRFGALDEPRLGAEDFRVLRDVVNAYCGIDLAPDQRSSVERRLRDRVSISGYENFAEYVRFLRASSDPAARSAALFVEAGKVLQHPRCLNCHPDGDRPSQGTGYPHQPPVQRGADGHGITAMRCTTCHQTANFEPGRVPGHPNWHLAPASMAWQQKSLAEICAQVKDPARNGGRTMAQVEATFGAPSAKHAPISGPNDRRHNPPITRWDYPTFSVYFEYSHVVDAVASKASPTEIGPMPVQQ